MNYLSVCSGIEAITVAWEPLGFKPIGFSEIEPFPSAVLKHHYPNVQNFGDMTQFQGWNINATIDILAGGTPCQSFSVAGLRKGLADPRGNLMLTFIGVAKRFRPRWIVWENVPGVLSSNRGRDFGTFLGALVKLGYGFAYRVLDAQWFGVAQRRRRVFVVGHLGDATRAAKVLFECESLCRDTPPSREAGKGFTTCVASSFATNDPSRSPQSSEITNQVGAVVETSYWKNPLAPSETLLARDYKGIGNQDLSTGRLLVPATVPLKDLLDLIPENNSTRKSNGGENVLVQPIPIDSMNHLNRGDNHSFGDFQPGAPSYTLTKGHSHAVASGMAVRRLTPVECERLQGFPDGYTNIPWRKKPEAPDGPRYKSLGNSMAVPVVKWIGKRIKTFGNIE